MSPATENVTAEAQKEPVTVSMKQLTQGVSTVFAGVLQILESVQPGVVMELVAPIIHEERDENASQEAGTAGIPSDPVSSAANGGAGHDAPDAVKTETPAVTIDDITKVIVAKIKQKRSNNEAIGKLLATYKVQKVSELKPEQYEAFLTDISQI